MNNLHNEPFILLWDRKACLLQKATGTSHHNTKNRIFQCLLILLIFTSVVSYNDRLVLFQTHIFIKTSLIIILQFNSSSEHRFALSCTDHLLFFSSDLEHRLFLARVEKPIQGEFRSRTSLTSMKILVF